VCTLFSFFIAFEAIVVELTYHPLFQPNESMAALEELRSIVMESDISPFEVNHSGLIRAILQYITQPDIAVMGPRDQRLRTFLHVFAGCPVRSALYY